MDYCEIKEQLMKSPFVKARHEVIEKMPFDKDIIFVPVRTRKQAELCFARNIDVYQRTMSNGIVILCVPVNFETIIDAVSKYRGI